MKTTYNGMFVYANFDKTQCLLDYGIDTGILITTEIERGYDSPILIQGPVSSIKDGKDKKIAALYEKIKGMKYFIIIKEEYKESID